MPAGHNGAQAEARAALNKPAAHLVQTGAPAGLDDPASQGRHADEELLPTLELKVPAGHMVQEADGVA